MKESSQTDQQYFESLDVTNGALLLIFQYFVSCFNAERTDKEHFVQTVNTRGQMSR